MVRYVMRKPSHGTAKVHELAVLSSLPAASSLFVPGVHPEGPMQRRQNVFPSPICVRSQVNFPVRQCPPIRGALRNHTILPLLQPDFGHG